MADPILIAQSKEPIFLLPKMANRHGLIAGATGTGKTVTLQTLAENFSARGVPVFMADVKGDLAALKHWLAMCSQSHKYITDHGQVVAEYGWK
jgi:Flp pilus assembly CpaF family ATPase